MDNQRIPLLSWNCFGQGMSVEELRQSLICKILDLDQTRVAVQEELRKRDEQLQHLREQLNKAMREKDEANEKCQRLIMEKFVIQQQQKQQQNAPVSGISSIEDDPRRGIDSNTCHALSDCEESIVSSPVMDNFPHQNPPQLVVVASNVSESMIELAPNKPLPEKGKLLRAVMKAGPLLQTLLLAGPLPQWRHPPPPLESFEIPPVTIPSVVAPPPQQPPQLLHHQDSFIINTNNNNGSSSTDINCGRVSRKRVFCDGSDSSPETKYQRIVLH